MCPDESLNSLATESLLSALRHGGLWRRAVLPKPPDTVTLGVWVHFLTGETSAWNFRNLALQLCTKHSCKTFSKQAGTGPRKGILILLFPMKISQAIFFAACPGGLLAAHLDQSHWYRAIWCLSWAAARRLETDAPGIEVLLHQKLHCWF